MIFFLFISKVYLEHGLNEHPGAVSSAFLHFEFGFSVL